MSQSSKKKRKKETTPDKGKRDVSLKGLAAAVFKSITIYDSLKDWSANLKDDSAKALSLFHATYRGDGMGANTHLCHPIFDGQEVEVKRDERGVIECLKDSTGRIKGRSLEKLQIATYASLHGFKEVIIESSDDEEAISNFLMMPRTVQFTELDASAKKDFHSFAVELYSYGNKIRVFTAPAIVKELAALPFLDSSNVKVVLYALNNLLEKEAFKLDPKSLSSIEQLQTLLQQCDKPSQAKFYQALIGARVDRSSSEEKIKAFIANPSSEFARVLNLKKPYSAPLFERGTTAKVERVPLSSLGDGDEVLMSTITIDSKFYDSVRSDIGSFLVYKKTANLGIKKNKKWAELQTQGALSAKLLTTLFEAIAASNKGGGEALTLVKARAKPESDSDSGLDDLSF